jgi:Na+/melibiose symporter-like transporter
MQKITGVNNRLNNMNTASSMEILDKELSAIKKNIVPLTQQTPYTLLMMRVVEIGLPLFLSLFSIFFVLRYSLTEKRSHEIKDLLRQRNQKRSKEDGTGSEPVIG